MHKKVFIKNYGCQMNVRDSQIVCGILKKGGYRIVDEPDRADIVILNTCSVRQHAEDRAWSAAGSLKKDRIIGIIGCMAQNYAQGIFERAPNVSFIAGPADIDKIPGILARLTKDKGLFERKIYETDGQKRPEEIYRTGFYEDKNNGLVVISEGCSNFCSYCVVPYVRGPLKHRHYKDIIKEIEIALGRGITSVTLLGQNVNAYKDGDVDFVKLIELVNSLKGLKNFTFITSHPKDTEIGLFKAMAGLAKLKKHLHLPAQSGSDRILKLMNRNYSRKYYLDLVRNYRKIVKGGTLSTDIIVGFPSEDKKDFNDSVSLIKNTRFSAAYIFKYSPRPHTDAFKMADTVEKEEKEKRHRLILDLQREISKKNAKKTG